MLIYNVTTHINEEVHDEWLQWMQDVHIPKIMATGKFLNAKMSKVLVEEEMGGVTYSVQFTTVNNETLQNYYTKDAPLFRKDALKRFPNQFVSFRTELEVISEH